MRRGRLSIDVTAARDELTAVIDSDGIGAAFDSLAGTPDDADTVLAELRRLDDTEEDTLSLLVASRTFVPDDRSRHPSASPTAAPVAPPPRVAALVRAVRTGQGLDLHPSNFALDDDRLVYLDDDVAPAPPVPGAAHAILQRAEELTSYPLVIEHYATTLIEDLRSRLSSDDVVRLRLVDDLRAATPRSPVARGLRARLLVAFGGDHVTPEPVIAAAPEPAPELVAVAAPEPAPAAEPEPEPEPEPGPPPSEPWPMPPTSADGLPSGFIWPVVAGREVMRQLANRNPTPRLDRPFTYLVGDYMLSTSSQYRFVEVDDGRAELLRLARAQVARGAPPDVLVLVLAPDRHHGGHWIWTIAPTATDLAPP